MRYKIFLTEGQTEDNWNLEDITFRLEAAQAQLKMIQAELKLMSKKPLPPGDADKKYVYDTKVDTLKTRQQAVKDKIHRFTVRLQKHQEKMRGGSDRRASR
jgi:prefoldin subunit 5